MKLLALIVVFLAGWFTRGLLEELGGGMDWR